MIAAPVNDRTCLGAITEQVRRAVTGTDVDRSLEALARELGSTAALVRWIRDLPQRDDAGQPADGPKVDACTPVQRLRLPTWDPNCVERAALYLGVAELIDPRPRRQLATEVNPAGNLHTFPVEDGARVVLDPIAAPTFAALGSAGPRNGVGPVGFSLADLDRALRVAARAARKVGPELAPAAAGLALASWGLPPSAVWPIEATLRRAGLTLGVDRVEAIRKVAGSG